MELVKKNLRVNNSEDSRSLDGSSMNLRQARSSSTPARVYAASHEFLPKTEDGGAPAAVGMPRASSVRFNETHERQDFA